MNKVEYALVTLYSAVEHQMGKTRYGSIIGFIKIAICDTIVALVFKLIRGEKKIMSPLSFSKSIVAGPVTFEIAAADGQASLKVSADASLGGGQAAGALKFKTSAEVDLEDRVVADLGFALLESKFPGLASEIKLLQGLVDEQLGQKAAAQQTPSA